MSDSKETKQPPLEVVERELKSLKRKSEKCRISIDELIQELKELDAKRFKLDHEWHAHPDRLAPKIKAFVTWATGSSSNRLEEMLKPMTSLMWELSADSKQSSLSYFWGMEYFHWTMERDDYFYTARCNRKLVLWNSDAADVLDAWVLEREEWLESDRSKHIPSEKKSLDGLWNSPAEYFPMFLVVLGSLESVHNDGPFQGLRDFAF